jgi:hypothetical protein
MTAGRVPRVWLLSWGFVSLWSLWSVAPLATASREPPVDHCAVSTKPQATWTSGFLSGNGNLGVVMHGDPHEETLVVTGKLYLPRGESENVPDLAAFKDEFRKAGLAAGRDGPAVVNRMIVEKIGTSIVQIDPLHPAFTLRLAMRGGSGAPVGYRMTQNFTSGELMVRWFDDQGEWTRRIFVSRPDGVIVMALTGPKGRVGCELAMEVGHPQVRTETSAEDGWLAAKNTYVGGKGGYDNLIRIVPSGGRSSSQDGRIVVENADGILLIMHVRSWKAPLPRVRSEAWAFSPEHPNFRSGIVTSRLPEMKGALSRLTPDYDQLFAPHAKEHGALYGRVALDLNGGEDRSATSEELLSRAAAEGVMSHALAERLYHACRYLTICSTGDTPPNLQGIWTGTWSPDWSGGYTLDSNLQLGIQSLLSGNLPELMEGFFDLVDSWLPDWRLNARKLFGFRGALASLHASSHCLLLPRPGFPREQTAIGNAGWLLHFYYDYYQFTGDREFLSGRFLPLAREIALFYEDFLAGTEDDEGRYRFYLGSSPEQHTLIANATYSIAVAKNVLTTLIAACRELDLDEPDIGKWEAMLAKMPPYLVNGAGELQEWSWAGVAEVPNHRHHSQFLPLYQFCEFDRERTPELWRAAGRAFDLKVREWLRRVQGANSNHITHGMMNQGQCAARLGRGDVVYEVVSRMVTRQYVHPGFMMGYWPGPRGFGFDPVGTIPDIVNNALIFAWTDTVDILPALPREWPTGVIRGILLRGQIRVEELAWDIPSKKVRLTLLSMKNQSVSLRFPSHLALASRRLDLRQGVPAHVEIALP